MSLYRTILRGILRKQAGKTVKGPYHPALRAKMHAERREKLERAERNSSPFV